MSEDSHEWTDSLSEREQNLAILLSKRMNDAVYTKIAFFNMKQKYERRSRWINWIVISLAALLTVGSVWESVPQLVNFGLAVTTGVVSFFSTYTDIEHKATESEKAGDSYNSILKEFQAYYYFVLKDDTYQFDKKRAELQRLLDRYDEINRNTLATDDDAFEDIDDEDIQDSIETTEEELKLLLNDWNLSDRDANTMMGSE